MNARPLQDITPEHEAAYAREGVVCLRGMFDREWVERLLTAWQRVKAQIEETALHDRLPRAWLEADPKLAAELEEDFAPAEVRRRRGAGFEVCKYMRVWDPDFRAFVHESPAAEIVGRVLGADEIRFYWDQIFAKRAGCARSTYWHNDAVAWPVDGDQLPSLWLALTPITHVNSLECIAGTQHDRTRYWPRTWNARRLPHPAHRPDFVDFEARRGDGSTRFLIWNMEPGDVLLFHPGVYHGAGANDHPTQDRVALSTRWIGDDIRWNPRPESVNTPGLPLERMQPGEAPEDEGLFPLVWRRAAA